MNKLHVSFFLLCLLQISCKTPVPSPDPSPHDLVFNRLATSWDEGIPLGNGMLGALVWKKDKHLRISLDRADIWDLRPMVRFNGCSTVLTTKVPDLQRYLQEQ